MSRTAVPVLLAVLRSAENASLCNAVLTALQNYTDQRIEDEEFSPKV